MHVVDRTSPSPLEFVVGLALRLVADITQSAPEEETLNAKWDPFHTVGHYHRSIMLMLAWPFIHSEWSLRSLLHCSRSSGRATRLTPFGERGHPSRRAPLAVLACISPCDATERGRC